MKRQYIFLLSSLLLFTSCNAWLDVSPGNEIDEKDLFASGSGYRSVLNGIYGELSTQSLYGQELTWGLTDVLAQNYDSSNLGDSRGTYPNAAKYYYDNANVEPVIQSIWSKAFYAISNCNALLQRIQTAENKLFSAGEYERNMIWGEALGQRALMHFDILRLFAPALNADDGKAYIPYVDKFPSTVNNYLSVQDVLTHIETDLLEARKLLQTVDCGQGRYLMKESYRIEGGVNLDDIINNDLFFTLRGFRMNYTAVTALLARVYSYAGKSAEAYDMATEVIDFVDESDNKVYAFSDYNTFASNPKMQEDLIFALSNTHLIDYYKQWDGSQSEQFLAVDYERYSEVLDEDGADNRWSEKGGLWATDLDNYIGYPKKYREETTYSERSRRIIPVIRLSEMHYIRAEHLARTSPDQGAAEVDIVSIARGCMPRTFTGLSAADFQEVLLKDAFKEFFGEGQMFFLDKKLGVKPHKSVNFVLPLPDNEQIY